MQVISGDVNHMQFYPMKKWNIKRLIKLYVDASHPFLMQVMVNSIALIFISGAVNFVQSKTYIQVL